MPRISKGVAVSKGSRTPQPRTRKKAPLWTQDKRSRFLQRLAETANITEAARAVKMTRASAYAFRRKSEAFARAWDQAMQQALDELETVLLERAIHGVDKPVYYGGKACGTVRHYSEGLAMFILKARRPDVYGRIAAEREELAGANDPSAREIIEERLKALREARPEASERAE